MRRKGHPVYTKTWATKAQAERWARQVEADIERGLTPSAASVVGGVYSVAAMIGDYRRLRETSRPVVDASTEHYNLQRLEAYLGDLDATRLKPEDLVGYAQRRADEGAGPYTVNMEVSKLGTVMRMVASLKHMALPDVVHSARPLLSHLQLIGGGGRRERRPTDDELTRIIAHMEVAHGRVYSDIVRFAVGTAMRRGEIVRITWDGLDVGRRLVLVRDRKDPRQKAGNDQWVPLLGDTATGDMWELIERQPRTSDRIFPVHEQTLSKYFTWTCRALSIPDLHFHDLRHHAISLLFERGYRIEQVALISGHRSWQHLKRYTNLRPEDLHKGPSGR